MRTTLPVVAFSLSAVTLSQTVRKRLQGIHLVDMEGIGCVHGDRLAGNSEYAAARRWMRGYHAVIQDCSMRRQEIVVNDSHGGMRNIPPDA